MNTLADDVRARLNGAPPARPGSNFPPEPIPDNPIVELEQRLERDHTKWLDTLRNMEIGVGEFPEKITKENEERVTSFIAQCRGHLAYGAAAHAKENQTYLALGRCVHTFFLRRMERFSNAKRTGLLDVLNKRLSAYQSAEREAARKAQEEEKRLAAEAAAAAAQEAEQRRAEAARLASTDRAGAKAMLEQAEAAEQQAEAAQKVLHAPLASGQISGEFGGTSYIRENWDYEVTDPFMLICAAAQPPHLALKYLIVDDGAVKAAIAEARKQAQLNGGDGVPKLEIPGIRIFKTETSVTRR